MLLVLLECARNAVLVNVAFMEQEITFPIFAHVVKLHTLHVQTVQRCVPSAVTRRVVDTIDSKLLKKRLMTTVVVVMRTKRRRRRRRRRGRGRGRGPEAFVHVGKLQIKNAH